MKLTEKTKKYLAVGGGAIVCVALIAAISLKFDKTPAGGDTLPEESSSQIEVEVHPSSHAVETTEAGTEEKEPVTQPDTEPSAGNAETSQPLDTRAAQTDQIEQSIQPEVTKPAEPEDTVKTNPTQKPDGAKVETPPVPVEHDAVETPTEPTAAPDQPQAGDVQDGKTYLPGFGYIENSGDNQENHADDMYENGNKIGVMD